MKRIIIAIICFFSVINCANARSVIADLSLRHIEIHSGFTGTEILLFGARNDAGDILVVVRGPLKSYIVRKKEQLFGIWTNTQQEQFNHVNSYFSIAASRPLADFKNNDLLNQLRVGFNNIHLEHDATKHNPEFTNAFMNNRIMNELYQTTLNEVSFIGDTLFRSILIFPKNIPRGQYVAEIYLISDGKLKAMQSTPIEVNKTGLDAFIYDFAYDYSALYGIVAVLVALGAGWLAGIIFRKV